jgi:flagellin-like protein
MGLKVKANTTMEVGRIQLVLMLVGAICLGMAGGWVYIQDAASAVVVGILGLAALVVPVERSDQPAPEAKRKLRDDTKAVSPVIAVILMVAITVVLAATVFVLVTDIQAGNSKAGPQIAWRENQADDTLTVQQAPTGLNWTQFTVQGCTGVPTGTLDAGDTVTGCSGAVTVRHNPSNSLVYQGRFD